MDGESLDLEVMNSFRFTNQLELDEFELNDRLDESNDYYNPEYEFGFHLPEDWEIRPNPALISPTTDLVVLGPKDYPDLVFAVIPVLTNKSPDLWYAQFGGRFTEAELREIDGQ